jgi:hypothetical protein
MSSFWPNGREQGDYRKGVVPVENARHETYEGGQGPDEGVEIAPQQAPPPRRIPIDLGEIAKQVEVSRTDQIKGLAKLLTYGEMIAMCEDIWKQSPGTGMAKEDLPGVLHRWATGAPPP